MWDKTPRGSQIRRTDKERDEQCKAVFRTLRDDADRVLKAGKITKLESDAHALALLGKGQIGAQQALKEYLDRVVLWGHDEQLIRLIHSNLVPQLKCCFANELKSESRDGIRAWRAYQRLVLDAVQFGVAELNVKQEKVLVQLAEWDQRWFSTREGPDEWTGKSGVQQAFDEAAEDIVAALADQFTQEREITRGWFEQTWAVVTEEAERTRGVVREEAEATRAYFHAVEERQRNEEAEKRAAALADYLGAVQLHCNSLPYSIGGVDDVSLTDLYVEQALEPPQDDRSHAVPSTLQGAALSSIHQLLADQRHLLIEGGPGAGKSTLLGALTVRLIEAHQRGERAPIPVPLAADQFAQLSGGFAERLAEHLNQQLGARSHRSLPADFFATAPIKDTEWLILVDGLDLVSDFNQLSALTSAITRHANEPQASLYRFVITSRPGPALKKFPNAEFSSFQLASFGPEQVRAFATKRFGQKRMDEVNRFLTEVERRQITDLVQIPLLLAMAARIFEQSPSKQLPTKRVELYSEFVRQMNVRDQKPGASRWQQFREQWTRAHPEGEKIAKDLYLAGNRLAIVTHLAAWQQDGHRGSLLTEAQAFAERKGWLPPAMEVDEALRGTLEFPLMQTGLVVRRGGDLAFVHDTFQEFLAAKAFANTYSPDDTEAWNWVVRWRDAWWREPVRFLLEIWSYAGQDVASLLDWICRPFGTYVDDDGVVFVGETLALGLNDATNLADHEADGLGQAAGKTSRRASQDNANLRYLPRMQTAAMERQNLPKADAKGQLPAAQNLRALRQEEMVLTALRALVEDPADEIWDRLRAAKTLRSLRQEEIALPALRARLENPAAHPENRLEAAELLGALGQGEMAVPVVRSLLEDPAASIPYWLRDAELMREWGLSDLSPAEALEEGPVADRWDRLEAARMLQELGQGETAVPGLRVLLEDPAASPGSRLGAAWVLQELGQGEMALPVVRRLLKDPAASPGSRLEAAELLVTLGQAEMAVPELRGLLEDPAADRWDRLKAARDLQKLGQVEMAVPGLRGLLEDPVADRWNRLRAARMLQELGQGEAAVSGLRGLQEDPAASPGSRLGAAWALGKLGQGEMAVPVLRALLEDPAANRRDQRETVWVLQMLVKGEATVPEQRGLLENPSAHAVDRREATRVLQELGQAKVAVSVVRSLLEDPAARLEAAELLGALKQGEIAVPALRALVEDPTTKAWHRLRAAKALSELQQGEAAVSGLRGLLEDPAASPKSRLETAGLLQELGQGEAAVSGLRGLLEDPVANRRERLEAARMLQVLGQGEAAVSGLRGLLEDPAASLGSRLEAARVLQELEQGEAAVPGLRSLVEEPMAGWVCLPAAEILGSLGRGRDAVELMRWQEV